MRRVSSIALVHETLSVSIDEEVDFDEHRRSTAADALLMSCGSRIGSGCVATERSASIPAEIATALVLVMTELVQNALRARLPRTGAGARVTAAAVRARGRAHLVASRRWGRPAGRRSEAGCPINSACRSCARWCRPSSMGRWTSDRGRAPPAPPRWSPWRSVGAPVSAVDPCSAASAATNPCSAVSATGVPGPPCRRCKSGPTWSRRRRCRPRWAAGTINLERFRPSGRVREHCGA